jgi:hypothetical protein
MKEHVLGPNSAVVFRWFSTGLGTGAPWCRSVVENNPMTLLLLDNGRGSLGNLGLALGLAVCVLFWAGISGWEWSRGWW